MLAVTKDKILTIDPVTNQVEKEVPLTNIKRWAATDKNITLDLGDHASEYQSFSTADGESISQLISGYIDITLKSRKGLISPHLNSN